MILMNKIKFILRYTWLHLLTILMIYMFKLISGNWFYLDLNENFYSTMLSVSASIMGFYLATISILINNDYLENTKDVAEIDTLQFVFYSFTINLYNQLLISILALLGKNTSIFMDTLWLTVLILFVVLNFITISLFIRYIQRIINTRRKKAIELRDEHLFEKNNLKEK